MKVPWKKPKVIPIPVRKPLGPPYEDRDPRIGDVLKYDDSLVGSPMMIIGLKEKYPFDEFYPRRFDVDVIYLEWGTVSKNMAAVGYIKGWRRLNDD